MLIELFSKELYMHCEIDCMQHAINCRTHLKLKIVLVFRKMEKKEILRFLDEKTKYFDICYWKLRLQGEKPSELTKENVLRNC